LHFNDFDLFYANIRLNAVARADAFLARTAASGVSAQKGRSARP
jgi:hypothetical protein